jgi:hypothetical protein
MSIVGCSPRNVHVVSTPPSVQPIREPRIESNRASPSARTLFSSDPAEQAAYLDGYNSGFQDGLAGNQGWACSFGESKIKEAHLLGGNCGRADGNIERMKRQMAEHFRKQGKSEDWIRQFLEK